MPLFRLGPRNFVLTRLLLAVKPLPVSLEDLYKGATKKLKVTKKRLNGQEEANVVEGEFLRWARLTLAPSC